MKLCCNIWYFILHNIDKNKTMLYNLICTENKIKV